jgi:membrane fusion protein, heavy metal efflux system
MFCGCRAGAPSPADESPAGRSARNANDEVQIDSAQLEQLHIEEISPHAPAAAIRATGTIEFNADRVARILPPVSGQVRDLAVNVGDNVVQNGVLFVLSSREIAAAITDHLASHKDKTSSSPKRPSR